MATTTAAAAIDGIQRRLESGAVRRGLPSKFDEVLNYLKQPLCTLRVVPSILMEDQSLDATVRVREIKSLLYELEDLLDELECHGSIRHRPSRRTWKATLFWLSSPLILHTSVAPRLDKISRRVRYATDRSVRFCSRQHRRAKELPKPQQVGMKCISSSVVLCVNNLAYDFLRYLTRDDVVHLDYGMAPSGSVGKPPFRYATLTCYSEESATAKYLVSSAKAVLFRNCEATKPIADIFPVLRNTRLLDLNGCPLAELPASVDQLNHLRYLNISGFRIRALPNEMGCLQNLEFLDISKTS